MCLIVFAENLEGKGRGGRTPVKFEVDLIEIKDGTFWITTGRTRCWGCVKLWVCEVLKMCETGSEESYT